MNMENIYTGSNSNNLNSTNISRVEGRPIVDIKQLQNFPTKNGYIPDWFLLLIPS